jgi:energy-coupling factor transporter ATP-binding protein EcfA2
MTAYILKSAIAMAVLLGVYYLFLEREKMHRFNRFYLLGALVFSLVLPFISIPIYVEAAPITIPQDIPFDAIPQPLPTPAPEVNYWVYAAIVFYALVTLLLAVRFARNILKFYILKKKSTVAEYNGATLVLLDDAVLPHTFLNNIYLCKKEFEHRLIEPELLTHELAHVRQKHTLDILFIELLKTILWFNPLPYLYKRAIQMNHEFLADESTIENHHLNIPTYQQMLLDKATPYTAYALASSINFSITKKRFIMMTKTTSSGKRTLLQAMMLPVLALTTTLLCYEVIAQQPKTSTPAQLTKTTTADRDEYYSNVQVIINDKARNVSINKKYEALTAEEKDRYITDVPQRGSKKYHYPGDTFILNISKVFKDDKIVAAQGYDPKTGAPAQGFVWPPSDKIKSLNLNKFSEVQNDSLRKLRPELYPTPDTKLAQIFITYENDKGEIVEATTFFEGGDNLTEAGGATVKMASPIKTVTGYLVPAVSAADTNPQPEFPGGIGAFYGLINKEFKVPDVKEDMTARIYIEFIIETDGSMANIKALNDPGNGMAAEAERVLKTIDTKWSPGMVKGKAVRTSYSLPIIINIRK